MEQKRTKKCLKTTRKKYSKKDLSAVGYRRNTRRCETPEENQIKNSSPWQVFGGASTARSVGRMCDSNWLWVAILAASSSASSPPLHWPPPLASRALFPAALYLDAWCCETHVNLLMVPSCGLNSVFYVSRSWHRTSSLQRITATKGPCAWNRIED